MRIGINTLAVNRTDFGGGEKYLYFLLRHLAEIDQKNEYFVFTSPRNQEAFSIQAANFCNVPCLVDTSNRIKRIFYEQAVLQIGKASCRERV